MSERDWAYLERYIRELADALGLRDYEIEVSRESCEGDYARVTTMGEKQWASVQVGAEFRTRTPEQQRRSIVHEMLHVHWSLCTNMIAHGLSETTGKPFAVAFYNAWNMADERAVDAIARAIAPRFPLPEWPATEAAA